MAVNFPNSPINGNTYTYLDIQYTFVKVGTDEGYWKVSTPASVGVATSTEINTGTDNAKYISPLGLEGSKYVREDVGGETLLNANGATRLKTTVAGIEVTGKLFLDGEIDKNGFDVPIVVSFGSSDNIHYRIWSNGLREVWGIKPVVAGGSSFTLPIPIVSLTSLINSHVGIIGAINTVAQLTDSTTIAIDTNYGSSAVVSFEIKGY